MTVELKEWRSFSPAKGLSDAGIKRKSSSLNVVLTEQVGRGIILTGGESCSGANMKPKQRRCWQCEQV